MIYGVYYNADSKSFHACDIHEFNERKYNKNENIYLEKPFEYSLRSAKAIATRMNKLYCKRKEITQ